MPDKEYLRAPIPRDEQPISRDDIAASIMKTRMEILKKYPIDKSLVEIWQADPEPKLRDLQEILTFISGDSLQLDQIFDMEKAKAAWEEEKAAHQKARDEALAVLESDISNITKATMQRLMR